MNGDRGRNFSFPPWHKWRFKSFESVCFPLRCGVSIVFVFCGRLPTRGNPLITTCRSRRLYWPLLYLPPIKNDEGGGGCSSGYLWPFPLLGQASFSFLPFLQLPSLLSLPLPPPFIGVVSVRSLLFLRLPRNATHKKHEKVLQAPSMSMYF